MVRYWNGEEDRDKKEQGKKGQPRSRLQVVETLIGCLCPSEDARRVEYWQMTYETSEENKPSGVEWRHTVECLAQ